MDRLKIALCQYDIAWEDAQATLARIEGPVRNFCERHGPDLLVFPETFSVGFTMNPSVAEPEDGPSTQWLRRMAASCRTAVAASVPTLDGGQRFNRCRFIAPDGREWRYDKRHLFTPSGENGAYVPGDRRCTVDYLGWRIELNVCYDLRFPVWSRNEDDRYDLLLNIANWPETRIGHARALLKARAIENASYAAFCNRTGEDAFCRYNGRSAILDYVGDSIARSIGIGGLRFFSATLDLGPMRYYRQHFPALDDADSYKIMNVNQS